jgi:hypothetical protein
MKAEYSVRVQMWASNGELITDFEGGKWIEGKNDRDGWDG